MECNKDEAKRAMGIASRKMIEKDYINAKKFACKAQKLYPLLDGLDQLMMTIEVYVMGAKRICGETDWYAILGLKPFADEETIKKQYRKMAIVLHPDKNKSQGAEGAFQLLSEAWSLLSDPPRKSSYDLMRQVGEIERHLRKQKGTQQNQPTRDGSQNVGEPVVSSTGKDGTKPASGSVSSVKKDNGTFWTQCGKCKTRFEYLMVYLNKTLRCPTCRESFLATETTTATTPETAEKLAISPSHQVRRDTSSRTSGATNQAANVVQPAQDGPKRGFVEWQKRDVARGNSDPRNVKKPRTDGSHVFGPFAGKWSNQMMLPCDITKAVVNKAHQDIFDRLPTMVSETVKDAKAIEREKKDVNVTSKATEKTSVPEVIAIVVPDSDFHNFDLDRSENSFGEDEIWAAYDNDDGMPRFYARIQKVVSLEPFKMRISWLNAKTCSEFGPIEWIGSGFVKTCGDFKTGRYESTGTLNAFSHKVDFTKGARGVLCILPKKGQVWALYRNWSPEWDKNTPNEVVQKYDMVEVLDDYTEEEQSVTVALLHKVEGFRAVFRRSTEKEDVRKIAKEEMFRFSHQVPCYVLTGKEADNAPGGCLELDPAATPCELLTLNAKANEPPETQKEKSESAVEVKSSGPDGS